jgi:hypothetical protein
MIYTPQRLSDGPGVHLVRKSNQNHEPTVYIIDESSMLSDMMSASGFFRSDQPLLKDLLTYIKEGNQANKVIFIGDEFQLPPVNETFSPALSQNHLHIVHGLAGHQGCLHEVMRQKKDSYILRNATRLREAMSLGQEFGNLDCRTLTRSTQALYRYIDLFDPLAPERVVVIAWTNKDVNWFNHAIRQRLGLADYTLSEGDIVTTHVNWYRGNHLISKGERARVVAVSDSVEYIAGLTFAEAELEFRDSSGKPYVVRNHVMLDSLRSTDGNISSEAENALFAEAMVHNVKFRESGLLSDDRYLGAFRLRHAYALTCHRAQGNEWQNVILHPFVPRNDYRWLYTAVTRASDELYTFAA